MTPRALTEGLTAAEARCALLAFLTVLDPTDGPQDLAALATGLQRAVALTTGLSLGTITAIDDGRCRLTVDDLAAIQDSGESSYQLALQLNVPASTVRAARQRLREAA